MKFNDLRSSGTDGWLVRIAAALPLPTIVVSNGTPSAASMSWLTIEATGSWMNSRTRLKRLGRRAGQEGLVNLFDIGVEPL
ncbi:MAG: hypothetical protein KAY24_13335 [Candidatus Eisenbacteria sp.]|nr:hypothetical protein [Candidatus Eisenbacteria bacterium]